MIERVILFLQKVTGKNQLKAVAMSIGGEDSDMVLRYMFEQPNANDLFLRMDTPLTGFHCAACCVPYSVLAKEGHYPPSL
jgi:hypothetical protein